MFSDLSFRIRSFFLRERAERDLDDELRFHYEQQIEKNVAGGMSRKEAERRTRLAFGGLDQIKEECHDARGISFIEIVLHDIRFALRTLRKSPGFTSVAVLTLALGIGATTAIFSVLHGVLFKALPYPHPEELVSVEISPLALDPSLRGMAPEDYFIFREQGSSLQDIGIYAETDSDRDVNVTGFAEPERVHALYVTDGVLSVLGIPAVSGRIFSPSDDSPGAPPTVVMTYAYWQRKFGGQPAVGKTMVVDGKAREIIGVLPQNFRFLDDHDLGLILPLQLDRNKTLLGNFSYFGIARLKPGITLAQTSADIARMLPITLNAFPPSPGLSVEFIQQARLSPSLFPLKQDVVGRVGTVLWVLMGGIGMVLLIACANVANLLLVRTEGRQHELALRAALGATRRRIAVQLLLESAVLGLLGGIFGLGFTFVALPYLVRLAPAGLPRMNDISVDVPVLLFTLGIALLTNLLFGLIPALKYARVRARLSESGRTLTSSRERHRAQNSLVALQVALALVLLICSGLMIRTFRVLTHVNPGFVGPAELQTFRIAIPSSDVPEDAGVPRIEQQIQDKLAGIPGVSSVGFSSAVPMDGDNRLDNVYVSDHIYAQGTLPPLRHLVFISPGYLRTLGTPLIAGRDLEWSDTYNMVPVALVSENFAREYWPAPEEALGRRIRISGSDDWREIVGVVGDLHDEGVDRPARTTVYWPTLLARFQGKPFRASRYVSFAVRSPRTGSEELMKQIQQAVWSIDANLPLARAHTLDYYSARLMARTSFTLVMLGIAGGMALLLGMVGLYGVLAYSVSQRTREIGVRMAFGAQPRRILVLVLGRGMVIVSVGLALGVAAALIFTRVLSSMLVGVRPNDPLTYALIVPLLAIVALAACYIPAHRATRVEPMVALRYE
jgi:predicted permease